MIRLRCCKCGCSKKVSEFARSKGRKRGYSYKCKTCQRRYAKKHYVEHKPDYVSKSALRNRRNRDVLKAVVLPLKNKPCTDCGKTFPPCAMQFDHVRGVKRCDVAHMMAVGYSVETVLKEIAKCDLVCACCHAIRTDKRLRHV